METHVTKSDETTPRDFMRRVGAVAASGAVATSSRVAARVQARAANSRVLGANDCISVGCA
jgi:hypothetical protein